MPVVNQSSGTKAGTVNHFVSSAAPNGWLKANGALVSRSAYAALFAAIGTTSGAGDGSTTFALPDLRGEFIRGFDDGRGVDSGRSIGTGQSDAFQGHGHRIGMRGNAEGGGNTNEGGDSNTAYNYTSDSAVTEPVTTSYGSVRTASETRPRNVAMLACIKY